MAKERAMTQVAYQGVSQSDYELLHPEEVRGKLILTIRTDRPEAEIGLYDSGHQLAYKSWTAHRGLAETIHKQIDKMLNVSSKALPDVQGIVVYKGPGSFTGLRIGLSVANALAYSLDAPIVSTTTESWIKLGLEKLQKGDNEKIAMPEYGAPVHITEPRK